MATPNDSIDKLVPAYSSMTKNLYFIKPDDRLTTKEQLGAQIESLSAMLYMTTGERVESFSGVHNKIQHMYLFGCAALADECRQLMKLI